MRILIATDTYYPNVNGASYFTYRLATMLAKRGHEVSVICPALEFKDSIGKHEGVKVYRARSLPVLVHPDFRFSPLFLVRKSIRRFFDKIDPEVIHIQNHFLIGKAVLSIAKERQVPIMGTNHFMPENLVHYLHLPEFLEARLRRLLWNQFVRVYDQLGLVTSPTKTAAKLANGVGLKKEVVALSCGIDLERFNPRLTADHLKKRYRLPDRKTMLYVGRIESEKRIDVLIRALTLIKKKVDVQLVIAGTGKMRQSLEKLALRLGVADRVTFTGFVPDDDLAALYHVADLFATAGIAELQSIVTMEAMASGLPVVTVDAMALPELCHDGENGYLFPIGHAKVADDNFHSHENIKVLAERASRILSDDALRAQMGSKSLEFIQRHDVREIIKKYESLYTGLIAKSRKEKR